MNIIGPDALVFGVDDVAACSRYLTDYGLTPVGNGRFEALDGTAIVLAHKDAPELPAPLGTASMLRKTIYGVADEQTLGAIAEELGRDRAVKRCADGSIEAVDDMGFVLGFQVTVRRPLDLPAEAVNAPGAHNRPVNRVAVDEEAKTLPRTSSMRWHPVRARWRAARWRPAAGSTCCRGRRSTSPSLATWKRSRSPASRRFPAPTWRATGR